MDTAAAGPTTELGWDLITQPAHFELLMVLDIKVLKASKLSTFKMLTLLNLTTCSPLSQASVGGGGV